jgi:GT2 family glycosyltransferase
MKVLIGITAHNRADLLSKVIKSALEQDYPNKEVAVFDDASSDGTPLLRNEFPQVRWFRNENPLGYLHARNQLMRETNADLYFSLDDDAWFIKGDEISTGVAMMQGKPEVAALAYDILSPDRPDPELRTAPRKTYTFIGCGHMLRLSRVKEIGYYTPSPGFYGGEEQDLCLRLLDRHHEIMFLPGVHVWHDKSMKARDLSAQHASGVCNDLVFAFRRSPYPTLLWLIPAKIASHVRFALRHEFVRPCLQGIGMFLRRIPSLVPSRQAVSRSAFQEYRRRLRSSI